MFFKTSRCPKCSEKLGRNKRCSCDADERRTKRKILKDAEEQRMKAIGLADPHSMMFLPTPTIHCNGESEPCGCCKCTTCDLHKHFPTAATACLPRFAKYDDDLWMLKSESDGSPTKCEPCRDMRRRNYYTHGFDPASGRCNCCERCMVFFGGWKHWLQKKDGFIKAGKAWDRLKGLEIMERKGSKKKERSN